MNRWDHESLEWIHKIREENYEETKDKAPGEVLKLMRERTRDLVGSLGLKTIPAYEPMQGKSAGSRN